MSNKNFYIMLATSEWAGPSPVVMAGPEVTLHNGVYINEPVDPYNILLKVDDRAKDPLDFAPKDIVEPNKALLFSKRFIELLNGVGVDNVQYIDVDVTYEPTAEKIPYKAANVVGVVSGLDMDKSEVILTRKGNVLAIDKMCLDEDKLLGHMPFLNRFCVVRMKLFTKDRFILSLALAGAFIAFQFYLSYVGHGICSRTSITALSTLTFDE